jgi:methionyl-tRNA formyltransferase
MSAPPEWWQRPRRVTVVVDNPSWIVPFAEQLVTEVRRSGDEVAFARGHNDVRDGAVAFYLGCLRVASAEVLARNKRNLVVHASDLPKGRGFSPLTWQILEGKNRIPVCLLQAVDEVDAGPLIYREEIEYEGHELIAELQQRLGNVTGALCRRFLAEAVPPLGQPQLGEATFYKRRRPADSRLDPSRTIAEQFSLLRVVDNVRYPAWFEYLGQRYMITIEKGKPTDWH